jgi:hypothetical protein
MSAQGARKEIASIVTSLLETNLAIDMNPPILRPSGGIISITWPSTIPVPAIPFGTVADYRWLLENRQYNLLLFDGSLLQAALIFRRSELIKQSLCYYPCPVSLPPQDDPIGPSIPELVDDVLFGAIDSLEWLAPLRSPELSSAEGISRGYLLRMRAPLRFDYDPVAQGPLHPAAHLHLGEEDCRIPVYAPISFGNFVRFVFRSYYNDCWSSHVFLRALPARSPARCILREDESELFLECRT